MDLISEIKKIPPLTRLLCLGTVGITGAAKLGMLDLYWIIFNKEFVLQKFQVWRIYSSFFVGKFNLSFFFEMVMLYRALNELESQSYERRSSDLAYQLMWVAPAILAATFFQTPFPHKSLLISIIYLYSRLFPTGMTSIMGLIQVPISYQPYIIIAFDLFAAGKGEAMLDVVGCVVGHVWWWTVWGGDSSGRGVLGTRARAPEWLRRWMGESGPRVVGAPRAVGGGVYVSPPRNVAATRSVGGHQWGGGRRLGES